MPANLAAITRLIKEVLGAIKLRQLSLRAEFGLGDPAETGQLYGLLTPLQYGACTPGSVVLCPDFNRAHLSGEVQASLRFTPIALLAPFARFGWQIWGPR